MVGSIIYEQPANELLRTCLRLEHLFTQLDYHYQNCVSLYHLRSAIRLLLEIINILDRPDLKSKLSQEFHRVNSIVQKQKTDESTTQEQNNQICHDLQNLGDYLTNIYGKLGQPLRQNHFLNNIRSHLTVAGGDSPFETPAYHCWLQQSRQQQHHKLNEWLSDLEPIRNAIQLLLKIIRGSCETQEIEAQKGFYHCALPTYPPIQLVRIEVNDDKHHYPEISVGRHRLNVCFYTLNLTSRPEQCQSNFHFQLTLCKI